MTIENQILNYLKIDPEVSISELQEKTSASRQILHRILKRLLDDGYVEKIGSAPKVFYRIKKRESSAKTDTHLSNEQIEFLDEYFLLITEKGERLAGSEAMKVWCQKQKLPFEKTTDEFIITRKKYLQYIDATGLINGTDKIRNTKGFENMMLDKMYYCDFYAIERFGKTKLGTLLHFAKQGQNRKLMQEIISLTKSKIESLIKEKKVDAVGYIPPTIKRQLQFMSVLQKGYNLSLPHLSILKVSGEIPVPQKALGKINERIDNARSSIVIRENRLFNHVLLLDDAVGSGATIHETAAKLLLKGICKKVTGLAITGSFKGFDVIQEV